VKGRQRQDTTARSRRDAAFLALTYSCGLRRSEAVADLADLDLLSGELRVRRGKGRKPRQLTLPRQPFLLSRTGYRLAAQSRAPSSVRCSSPGACCVRATSWLASVLSAPGGSVVSAGSRPRSGPPLLMTCDRTWIGDLLDLGVDLATVQKMAGHASASTTGRYDGRARGVRRRAAGQLQLPYVIREH
jgi:integrase